MKFLLVDRIVALQPGESITALKALTSGEEYLADHFPRFPVMPGVLMVETLVQAGAWLLRATDDFADSVIALKRAKAVKFNDFVRPGESLTVRLTLAKREPGVATLKADSDVEGRKAVSARLELSHFSLADRSPELTEKDARLRAGYREEFARLWPAPAAV
ncbi:MAG: 3-hydroxyacyl-ACP dehydratase FabZ family protein [Planctomycetota bacterium]